MGAIYTGIGAVVLVVSGGLLWGFVLLLEMLAHAMGPEAFKYALMSPLIVFLSYLVGYGVHEFRASKTNSVPRKS